MQGLAAVMAGLVAATPIQLASDVAARRIDALDRALLAGPTATEVLRRWCAERGLAAEPRIRAEVDRGAVRAASAATRLRLAVEADAPVAYRRVRLFCGAVLMSEAENWYVPARLTAAMNAALDGGDTPFGTAILPLGPRRMNLSSERLWRAGEGPLPAAVLRHRALVFDGAGRPLAEVVETYQRDALGR